MKLVSTPPGSPSSLAPVPTPNSSASLSCRLSSRLPWPQRSLLALAVAAGAYACGSSSPTTNPGTGGAPDTGGAPATGGVTATGGATGGVKATGGAGTGGVKATGGMKATGGTSPGLTYNICGTFDTLDLSRNPQYFYQNDVWNTKASGDQCVDVTELSYKVTSYTINLQGSDTPASYPSYVRGCHQGHCSADGILPKQYSSLTTVTSSVQITPPSGAKYDVSYDLWLDSTAKKDGQNQTEIMVWLDWSGVQPVGSSQGNATIGGQSYEVWFGSPGWNVASFRRTDHPHSLSSMDLKPIIDYAISKGWAKNDWYLTSVQFGFEGWSGLTGAQVTNLSIDVK